uniref:SusC/RagA family TonB-linked outer membrane protein n=1 Tax=Pedobacter schmidteae TaxID=2201271 RepID=UPI0018D514BE|nr:SusC/RagA family TonB-linked outer membrane protein [Pedobacter schmidteae]
MRIIVIIMTACLLQVSATTRAQISLNEKKAALVDILTNIKKQTGTNFLYNIYSLKDARPVTVQFKNASLEEVLKVCFENQPLSYTIKNNTVVIVSRKTSGTQEMESRAFLKITGVVRDTSGITIPNVSIVNKTTGKTYTTDNSGNFSLDANIGDVLSFSSVGFQKKEVIIKSETRLFIVLSEERRELEQVVVTALGIKRSERTLSYNADVLNGEVASTVKDPNFVNSLTGKVAGLSVNSSSSGPGAATRVVIRGNKSIEQNNNVLYVIDGIPIYNYSKSSLKKDDEMNQGIYSPQPVGGEGIGDLNPDDIESMTVLLGPAASALYGGAAANGAIVITTKKGNIGKAKITVSNQTSFSNPVSLPKFQNRYGNLPGVYASWGGKLDQPQNYDPAKFFNTGINVQNSVSLSTGNEKNQTYLSAATTNANGIMPNNKYSRYNFTFRNTTSFLNDKMTLDVGASYVLQKNQNMIAQGQYFNPLVAVYTYPRGENFEAVRLYEQYNEGREINTQRWIWGDEGLNLQNPYWTAYRNLFNNDRKRYMLNANLKYDIASWINVVGRIRLDNSSSEVQKRLYASTITLFANSNGAYSRTAESENQLYGDVIFNINKPISQKVSFNANVGSSYNLTSFDMNGMNGNLGTIPNLFALRNIDRADGKTRALENAWRQQNQAVFGNFEFGYKSQLFLTLTGRNEWDSALAGMSTQSYFYPSIGLSALVSEMTTLPKFISYFKVRGSYASVGSPIPRNLSIPHYEYDDATGNWKTNTFMPIGDLLPERTNSYEAGVDLRFLDNKIDFKATLYKSNTYNQTLTVPISESSGYSSIIAQTGNIENKGIELGLGYKQKLGDFSWKTNVTAAANRNKIVDLGRYTNENGVLTQLDQIEKTRIGSSLILLKKGGSLGDLWTTNVLKHDQNGYVYVDAVSGALASQDYLQKVGSLNASWNLGFSNNFTYKDFSLGFTFTARLGGKVVSYTQAILDAYGVSEASAISRDNGGIPINNGVISAESYYKTIGGTGGIYSNYVYSATNVRLQEANISYRIPKKWLGDKVNATASVIGRNLWMIYNKAPFDPENIASTSNYLQGLDYFMAPSLRNLGFSVKFEF